MSFFVNKKSSVNPYIIVLRCGGSESEKVEYEEYQVGTVSMEQTLTAAGELTESEDVTVDFSTSKTFKAMCVEEGDYVTEGQRLIAYTDGTYEVAETDGIITRTVYPEVPPRVEYALSDLGESMRPILMSMQEWGNSYKAMKATE